MQHQFRWKVLQQSRKKTETQAEETPLLMEHDKYQIRFHPEDVVEEQIEEEKIQPIEVEKEEITDVYEEEKTVPLKAVYSSADKKKSYEYTSLDIGVKEEIVLSEIPEENTFTSILEIPGLTIRKNQTDNGITIYDEDEIVAGIQAPNMNDATEEAYSEELEYDIEPIDEETGKYKLTLSVNEEYLKDEDRQYPVTIDPTLTWSGNSQVSDVYVLSKSPYNDYNFYDSGVTAFSIGKISQGISRAYLAFASLSSITGRYVESAKLTLTECSNSQSSQTVQAYAVNKSWSKTTLRWTNRPGYYSTLLGTVKTTGTYKKQYSLNLTTLMRNYANKVWTNYGIVLKNSNETDGFAKFFGARHATTTSRPKLTVVHYDKPTTATSASVTPQYVKKGSIIKATWEGISSKALSYVHYRLTGYDPATKAETGNIVSYSTSTKLGTTGSGSANIAASSGWAEGAYKLVIRGVDKGGCAGTGKGAVFYIDGTAPTMNTPTITPVSTIESPADETTPTIHWSNASDKYLKQIECKIDNGSYTAIGTTASGSYTVPEGKITGNGEHTIIVRVLDKAGNSKSYTLKYYLHQEGVGFEEYLPKENSLVIRNEYGKNHISWETEKELTDNVYYRIYRGENEDFIADNSSMVADNVKESYWVDLNSLTEKDNYYKIDVVRTNTAGEVEDHVNVEQTLHMKGISQAELSDRTGQKPYRGYCSFATPTGNGNVEYSSGNLSYEQEDVTLPSSQLPFTVTRYYNSQLKLQGMYGNGWTDSLHKELVEDKDGNIYFIDSDGSIYTFQKGDNGYTCAETKDYVLQSGDVQEDIEEEEPEELTSSYIGISSYETKSVDEETEEDVDSEEPEVFELEHAYTIKTKDNMLYRFNEGGQLVSVLEPNGTYLIYLYDDVGRLESVQSDAGKKISFNYDGTTGFVQSILLPDETKLTYSYENDNLIQVKHNSKDEENSIQFQYGYTEDGMTLVTDAKGQKYKITYVDGKVQKVEYPNQEAYVLTYNDSKTSVTKKSESGADICTTSVEYDKTTGKILKETAADGSETTYEYGYDKNPYLVTKTKNLIGYESITDGKVEFKIKEKVTETVYNEDENVTEETAEDGTVTSYEYDAKGEWAQDEPTSVTSEMGQELISKETTTYDENGNAVVEKNETDEANITITENTYDDFGNLQKTEVTEDDLNISVSECEYDDDGNVLEETTTSSDIISKETNSYDAMGRTTKSKDESTGEVTEYEYDYLGRVIRTETTLNGKTLTSTSAYDANGTVVSETDTAGVKTEYVYDEINRVTSRTVTKGESITYKTSYTYGDVIVQDGRSNRTVKNAYIEKESYPDETTASEKYTDQMGRVVKEKSAGLYSDYTYDQSGNQVIVYSNGTEAQSDAGKIQLTLYDDKGNQTATIINPEVASGNYSIGKDSVVTSQVYDEKGNVIQETDGEGIITEYAYDDSSRIVEVKEDVNGKGIITKASYTTDTDENTSITTITDAAGHQSVEVTDAAGLTKSTTDYGEIEAEKVATGYEYDSRGNQTKVTYENGAYQVNTYDDRNLLTKTVTYDENEVAELQTEYTYDDQYRQIRMVDSRKTEADMKPYRYTCTGYDGFGRTAWTAEIDSESEPSEELVAKHKITYHYDAEDKVTGIDYALVEADGVEGLRFTYNANRWLQEVKAKIKGKETPVTLRKYTYDTQGKVSEITEYPGFADGDQVSVVKKYTYNNRDLVASMTYKKGDTLLESYTYKYDKNGYITEKTEVNHTPKTDPYKVNETKSYTYDGLGQLKETVVTDHKNADKVRTITYEYDKAGNRVKKTEGSEVISYTYNGLDQLLTVVTELGGAETGQAAYAYDENGNQIKETDSKTGITKINEYDAENRLSKATITVPTDKVDETKSITQENLYNGNGQRIRKTEGAKETHYFYQDDVVSYTTDSTGEKKLQNLLGLEGNIISAEEKVEAVEGSNDSLEYYLYNKDIQGSTTSILNQSGTGELSYEYDDFGETEINGDSIFKNEVCYTGGIYDESTGLYYLNARYYNPETGRFLTEDTYRGAIDEPDTLHLYAYCKNNPVNYVDPNGHFAITLTYLMWGAVLIYGVTVYYVNLYRWRGKTYYVYKSKKSKVYNPDPYARAGQKKQGRENKEKKKKKNWEPKNNKRDKKPAKQKKHTPGKEHRKYK